MPDNDKTYGGYESGQDWLDDIAIEDYLLDKVEIGKDKKGVDDDKKSKSHDPRRSPRRSNL